jgi:hypothetical protein
MGLERMKALTLRLLIEVEKGSVGIETVIISYLKVGKEGE